MSELALAVRGGTRICVSVAYTIPPWWKSGGAVSATSATLTITQSSIVSSTAKTVSGRVKCRGEGSGEG